MAKNDINAEKRAEIVAAFMDSVRELGLERASMGEVGRKIGLDRSSLYYYFKTKQELIEESARHLAAGYLEQLEAAIARFSALERARQLVEHTFGPSFHQPKFAAVMDEFNATSNRDKAVEKSVAGIYRSYESAIVREIDTSYPDADQKDRRDVAYAISQLAEGASVFQTLGFGTDRRLAARTISLKLLDWLAEDHARVRRRKRG